MDIKLNEFLLRYNYPKFFVVLFSDSMQMLVQDSEFDEEVFLLRPNQSSLHYTSSATDNAVK